MRSWARYGAVALAAAALSFAVTHRPAQVVHAQVTYPPGCITNIPKSWGSFHGISEDGLAFEDQTGTIRVIAHPVCGNGLPAAPPVPDLEIRRQ